MLFGRKKKYEPQQKDVIDKMASKSALKDRIDVVGDFVQSPEGIKLLEKGFCNRYHHNEEATKQLVVIPFLQALGYGISKGTCIFPEAPIIATNPGGKKVDYAVICDDEVKFIVEVKAFTRSLDSPRKGELPVEQLSGYYEAFKSAEFAVLTNGKEFRFFGQDADSIVLSQGHKMSNSPFLVLNLCDKSKEYDEILDELAADNYKAINLNSIGSVAEERVNAARRAVREALCAVSSDSEMIQALRKASCCSDVISDDTLLEVFKDNLGIK